MASVDQMTSFSPAVRKIIITDELAFRRGTFPDFRRETIAMHELARCMADEPSQVLNSLVRLSLEICGAESAGVSILEGDEFRWHALKGELATFEGEKTPRNWSPCGVCLDFREPILMRHPEHVYDWIAQANITVPEVLLVPLLANGKDPIGTLWVVSKQADGINAEHARLLQDLASFAGVALHMIEIDARLSTALKAQRMVAQEMSHRVKNVFAVTASLVNRAARTAQSSEELAEKVTGRLIAMSQAHDLVGTTGVRNPTLRTANLRDLLTTIIEANGEATLEGPSILLNEQTVHALSLTVHELSTNATKYGAFSESDGIVRVCWHVDEDDLIIHWNEDGGPRLATPIKEGFGSTLVQASLAPLNGKAEFNWSPDGISVVITIPIDKGLAK